MLQKRITIFGLLAFASLSTVGFAAEQGTSRLVSVVTTQQGGGTTTNTISYNQRGLPSHYDIVGAESGLAVSVSMTYNTDDQIIGMQSQSTSPFGKESQQTDYFYQSGDVGRLIRVQSTVSNGYTFVKRFSYGSDGRIAGMTLQGEGPDGPISAIHTVDYDATGRLVGSSHSYSANGIEDTGAYSLEYGKDGTILSHKNKQPLNTEGTATYSSTATTLTVVEAAGSNGGGSVEKVSTFAPGPCRIPQMNDGFVVEQIFNGPPGFYPDAVCRE